MTDTVFALVWLASFILYLAIYTWHIPLRTQKKIESWLRSEESDETLLLSLEVIVKRIREQTLIDFEEFMLPTARDNLRDFYNGAMGHVAKNLKKTEEGSQASLMANVANELENRPWYEQMLASKLLPSLGDAFQKGSESPQKASEGLGLGKLKR